MAFMFTLLSMSFFATKRWRADANRLEDGIYWSLVKEPTAVNYYHKDIEQSAIILSFSTLEPRAESEIDRSKISPRLNHLLDVIYKIKRGEYLDLKKEKFSKYLEDNNEIVIQNSINRLNKDPKFAIKILEEMEKYDKKLVDYALDKLIESDDLSTIKKFAKEIGKERLFKALERIADKEDIEFNKETLFEFLKFYKFNCRDYYRLAQVTFKKFDPDSNLEVFKDISIKEESAIPSYLFLLFKYEMIEKAKEVLDEHPEDDFKVFRAFYILKKGKYNYKLSDLVNEKNVCL
jgi:hypothetical protein